MKIRGRNPLTNVLFLASCLATVCVGSASPLERQDENKDCKQQCIEDIPGFRPIRCDHEQGHVCLMKEIHYNHRNCTFTTGSKTTFRLKTNVC